MEVRKITVDIEAVLNDLWLKYVNDLEASMSLDISKVSVEHETYGDLEKIKACLDTLRWCNLISMEECDDMQLKADQHREKVLEVLKTA